MRITALCVLLCLASSAGAQFRPASNEPSSFTPDRKQSPAPKAEPSQASTAQAGSTTSGHAVEQLTNQTIISLVRAGLGPETVVAKINATNGQYDTSTNALIELKQAGVPDPVIAAMLNRSKSPVVANAVADNTSADPLAPHAPGIYLLDSRGAGRMMRIDATVANQMKTSNLWGYAFSYGLSSLKMKTVIPNANARVQAVSRRPTFYFYFNQSSPLASMTDFSTAFTAAATSPNEFSLVRFDQKKDHRETAVMSVNLGGVKSGVSDKARIAFSYDDVAPGVFRVTPAADLPPGEYGFVYSIGAGTGMVARIFDFSVS